jgi:hypothetical protein
MIATGDIEAIALERRLTTLEPSSERISSIPNAFVTAHKSRSFEWAFWAVLAADRMDVRVARRAAEAGLPFAQCYLSLDMLDTGGSAARLTSIERLVVTAPRLASTACWGIASRGFRVPRKILVIGAEARVPTCLLMLAEEVREMNHERARRLTLRAEAAGLSWMMISGVRGLTPDGRTLRRLARANLFDQSALEYLAKSPGGVEYVATPLAGFPVTRIARWCYRLMVMVVMHNN